MFGGPATRAGVKLVPKGLNERIIEPWELARYEHNIQGEIELQTLSRLQSQLTQPDGQVMLDWCFKIIEHHAVITGQLKLRLALQCQRCLKPVVWTAQVDTALCLLKLGQDEQNLPAGFESIVLSDSHVRLGLLVEDEILLALPFAPLHEHCPSHDYQQDEAPPDDFVAAQEAHQKENPFQVLAALKQR